MSKYSSKKPKKLVDRWNDEKTMFKEVTNKKEKKVTKK